MIRSVTDLISSIKENLTRWDTGTKPWFRGESGDKPSLRPKIAEFDHHQENYFLQSFRRKAGGLANVPFRDHIDMWLFLAQHYRVPTRLLDWTEGALHALYFAINRRNKNPRIYMLNARRLNDLAGAKTNPLNYPLTFDTPFSTIYIQLAWLNRDLEKIKRSIKERLQRFPQNQTQEQIKKGKEAIDALNVKIPIAFPATYQDQRMIAQRSCFTIHGESLSSIQDILKESNIDLSECLIEFKIDPQETDTLMKELNFLGISSATIFPDLDHIAEDLSFEVNSL